MDGQPHADPVPALLRRRAPLRRPQGRGARAGPTHHGAAFLRCARREPRPSVTRAGGLWGVIGRGAIMGRVHEESDGETASLKKQRVWVCDV